MFGIQPPDDGSVPLKHVGFDKEIFSFVNMVLRGLCLALIMSALIMMSNYTKRGRSVFKR